jgi:hypothetical protein
VKKHDVGVIILADQKLTSEDFLAIIESCDMSPARFVIVPDILGAFSGLIGQKPTGSDAIDQMINHGNLPCQHCLVREFPTTIASPAEELEITSP